MPDGNNFAGVVAFMRRCKRDQLPVQFRGGLSTLLQFISLVFLVCHQKVQKFSGHTIASGDWAFVQLVGIRLVSVLAATA